MTETLTDLQQALLRPDAEVTLTVACPACGGAGDQGDSGNAHLRACNTCDGTGEIAGRIPLGTLLDALGVARQRSEVN